MAHLSVIDGPYEVNMWKGEQPGKGDLYLPLCKETSLNAINDPTTVESV